MQLSSTKLQKLHMPTSLKYIGDGVLTHQGPALEEAAHLRQRQGTLGPQIVQVVPLPEQLGSTKPGTSWNSCSSASNAEAIANGCHDWPEIERIAQLEAQLVQKDQRLELERRRHYKLE